MIISRKTQSSLEFNTITSFIEWISPRVSKDFRRITTQNTEVFYSAFEKDWNSTGAVISFIKLGLGVSRGTKQKSFYTESLGWTEKEYGDFQNYLSKRGHAKTQEDHRKGSIRCSEYWIKKGYSEEEAKEKVKEIQRNYSSKVSVEQRLSSSPRRNEYWIKKGYSEEEAEQQVRFVQRRNSQRCREYWTSRGYSEEEAKAQVSRVQTISGGWSGLSFSKISQDLFHKLPITDSIHFATVFGGVNGEYMMIFENGLVCRPDWIDTKNRKIIEFDGDYWHSLPGQKERDLEKDRKYIEAGYSVLRIAECQYKNSQEEVIEQCLNFISN